MADAEVEAKYRKLAAKVLPSERIAALADAVWKLEAIPDVGAILQLTVREEPKSVSS
jgi:hypothetical protein